MTVLDSSLSSINQTAFNSSTAPDQSSNELDQADFIELLVAQIKNQDPTKPMDPSEFMNQLAQFSAVNGIQELNTSFDSLATNLTSDQALQAAALVGRDVLIPGGYGLLDASGVINGQVNLSQPATDVNLTIINAQGETVRTLSLGGYGEGQVQFQWDGFTDDGSASAPGNYQVIAEAMINGSQQAVEVELEIRVDSITLNTDGLGTVLNLASGESVPLSLIQQIK